MGSAGATGGVRVTGNQKNERRDLCYDMVEMCVSNVEYTNCCGQAQGSTMGVRLIELPVCDGERLEATATCPDTENVCVDETILRRSCS